MNRCHSDTKRKCHILQGHMGKPMFCSGGRGAKGNKVKAPLKNCNGGKWLGGDLLVGVKRKAWILE